uniref:BTB domain-containing protein n=1 Tax=Timema genevievae TaxID=629358 RepID=A0A7R9K4Z3_TIMGE|nr:unnamed protein product [Timema genevievae]
MTGKPGFESHSELGNNFKRVKSVTIDLFLVGNETKGFRYESNEPIERSALDNTRSVGLFLVGNETKGFRYESNEPVERSALDNTRSVAAGGMSGHIKIELPNVYKSLVNEGGVLHSEDVFITHSDWYVLLEHAKGGWLAISLYNQDITSDKHLKCYVEYEIKLLNHFERKSLVFKKNCTFSNGNGWGYENVIMITDLLNAVRGFVVNNTIVLQLYVAAGPLLKSFLNDKCLKESTTVEISKIVGKNSTLADRSEYLLKEEIGSDCEFIIEGEEQTKIKCSKIFLARASPVFEQMFYGSWARECNIIITDIDATTFKMIVNFAYGLTWTLDNKEQALNLFYAAHKYMIGELMESCIAYLWPHNLEDIWFLLNCDQIIDLENLQEAAMVLIRSRTTRILSDPRFLEISHSSLMLIVQQNELNINSEVELYNALVNWAKANRKFATDLRDVVGDAINHIRFLSMTEHEIVSCVNDLLTDKEKFDILKCMITKEFPPTVPPPALRLSLLQPSDRPSSSPPTVPPPAPQGTKIYEEFTYSWITTFVVLHDS